MTARLVVRWSCTGLRPSAVFEPVDPRAGVARDELNAFERLAGAAALLTARPGCEAATRGVMVAALVPRLRSSSVALPPTRDGGGRAEEGDQAGRARSGGASRLAGPGGWGIFHRLCGCVGFEDQSAAPAVRLRLLA